jgi:hypothetical protein
MKITVPNARAASSSLVPRLLKVSALVAISIQYSYVENNKAL